jgi:hypothetical protein
MDKKQVLLDYLFDTIGDNMEYFPFECESVNLTTDNKLIIVMNEKEYIEVNVKVKKEV